MQSGRSCTHPVGRRFRILPMHAPVADRDTFSGFDWPDRMRRSPIQDSAIP
jgi:hypothetical protein